MVDEILTLPEVAQLLKALKKLEAEGLVEKVGRRPARDVATESNS